VEGNRFYFNFLPLAANCGLICSFTLSSADGKSGAGIVRSVNLPQQPLVSELDSSQRKQTSVKLERQP